MAEMTAQREIQIPDGGIAGFMMSDEDFAELARQESERSFGNKGIAGFGDTATKMAALGRYGDDSIVHAQTGEIVVPKPVLDSNPELKQAIFDDMRARGIEDPERYVVGSETNSINPETGLMEFGFFSKVWSGVKKAASQTVKVLKKVAPIILPIALAMTPLGPIYGAALGSGIGTLLQGGSVKDALKSAAISGLSGAAFTGMTGTGTFSQNVSNALANPGARFAQTGAGLKAGFSGEGFGKLFTPYAAPAKETGAFGESISSGEASQSFSTEPVSAESQYAADVSGTRTGLGTSVTDPTGQYATVQTNAGPSQTALGPVDSGGTTFKESMYIDSAANKPPAAEKTFTQKLGDYYDNTKEFFVPSGKSAEEVRSLQAAQFNKDIAAGVPRELALQNAAAITGEPSFLAKYGPMTALIGAGAYGLGAFDEPEPEPSPLGIQSGPTAEEIIAGNPNKYLLSMESLTPKTPTYFLPFTQYASSGASGNTYAGLPANYGLPSSSASGPFQRPVGFRSPTMYAATGGEVYPRRNGGIMPNEGVPGKDSVRAMLMPGEFVMTTDAVRGAGDGNLNRGINNMYNVMAKLERKGRMS